MSDDWREAPGRRPPFRDDHVHVKAAMCSTCVFRSGDLMHLGPGRLRAIVDGNRDAGSALTCHKTLPYAEPGPESGGGEALCRGYWDGPGARSEVRQLAEALSVVREVP